MDVCGECDPDACEGDHLNDLANRKLLEIWRNGANRFMKNELSPRSGHFDGLRIWREI